MIAADIAFEFAKYANQLTQTLDELTEQQIWQRVDGIDNSVGILTKHLMGNLNHFFGAILGNTEYVRDRASEFNQDEYPRDVLLADFNSAFDRVLNYLLHS